MLADARCQRVASSADSHDELMLRLRAHAATHELVISTEPGAARWCITEHRSPAPPSPSAFVMLLRKHVEGAVLDGVTLLDRDRVVQMRLRAGPHRPTLVCELFGAAAQLVLLDEEGTVLGLHHPRRTSERLQVGEPYEPPPAEHLDPEESAPELPADPLAYHYATDARIREQLEARRFASRRTTVRQDIRRSIKRLDRLAKKLEMELERAENADAYRRRGELLQSAYGQVTRGARFVDVIDFYDPDQSIVRLELDPKLDLQANIAKAFHTYRRLQRAQEHLVDRVLETEEKLELARSLAARADDASDIEELDRVRTEAIRRQLYRAKQSQRAQSTGKAAPRLPYTTYTSRDGRRILVGRGSADNDRLTFQHGRGRDLWLHVEDWAGSHVIVPLARGESVPHKTLEDAALLAAHFSKGKQDVVVAVRYTLRSNVRKPKGLPPGRVTVADARTLDVRLDSPHLSDLLKTRSAD